MIEMFGLSEVGGHAVNEDAWDAWPHPHDPGCFLCVVADGMGASRAAAPPPSSPCGPAASCWG
jgi:hypothetical protein